MKMLWSIDLYELTETDRYTRLFWKVHWSTKILLWNETKWVLFFSTHFIYWCCITWIPLVKKINFSAQPHNKWTVSKRQTENIDRYIHKLLWCVSYAFLFKHEIEQTCIVTRISVRLTDIRITWAYEVIHR